MQIFGITKNHVNFEEGPADTSPLNTRLFTKLETSNWDEGSRIIAPVDNLSGEIEIIARIEEPIRQAVAKEDVGKIGLSYAIGMDFGSGQRGRDDGQFWRSKGARGYAPVGQFVDRSVVGNLRDHSITVQEDGGEAFEVDINGLRYTEVDAIPLISEYCDLQPGDLIYLGKLALFRGFESGPKNIRATCAVLPSFGLQSEVLENGSIRASLGEPIHE